MQVNVRDNNIDQALRVLKKELQREGVFKKVKDESAFESKGEKRRKAKAKAKAVTRAFKLAAKKMSKRDGIPLTEARAILKGKSPKLY
jgi:small subunit ribosomal protein S21